MRTCEFCQQFIDHEPGCPNEPEEKEDTGPSAEDIADIEREERELLTGGSNE
jgi:hypothetical protein